MTDKPQSRSEVLENADLGPRPAMVRTAGDGALTAAHKQVILAGLESGQSLATILRDNPQLPGASTINRERRANDAFAQEFDAARANGVAANIDEALDYQHSVRGNKGLSIAASKYSDAIMKSAPLTAPKEYGQLLKLAGADGNKLTVQLIAYGTQQPEAIDVTPVETQQIERSS